ncbi:hypothetical protein C1I93_11735 [Micromonospora endophytica]|uniref:Uncharacterized protein n=1 Tax=Micromonospora endophytica TaxID=515350 RepID=A0A2W2CHU8_9ACTN|nr:hypothetical protein C1I93_11735 [Micromonospora endophytica]RIW41357.1 hypothetical protein D3H59_26345 [Micromonospora endophytica]
MFRSPYPWSQPSMPSATLSGAVGEGAAVRVVPLSSLANGWIRGAGVLAPRPVVEPADGVGPDLVGPSDPVAPSVPADVGGAGSEAVAAPGGVGAGDPADHPSRLSEDQPNPARMTRATAPAATSSRRRGVRTTAFIRA